MSVLWYIRRMQTLIECVPNFSEGRRPEVVEAIVGALLAGPDVYLLDREMDADHNRSVITFVGTRESVGEAALRGIEKAAELIDLNHHRGAHPRLVPPTWFLSFLLPAPPWTIACALRSGWRKNLAALQNPDLSL